jgi:hypothetical protein
VPQPSQGRPATERVACEERFVRREPPACGATLEDDDGRYDARRSPPPFAGQARRAPPLDAEATEQILGVVNPGLDLHNGDGVDDRVEGEDVDTSAVSVMVEADLGFHGLTGVAKQSDERILHLRVSSIRERLFALDAELKGDEYAEGRCPRLNLRH